MSDLKAFDDSLRLSPAGLIAGFDEAGRGPLCGPVTAAGVILPPDFNDERINDSKKLTDHMRRALFEEIKAKAIFYHISVVSNQTIDEINILESSRLGMQMALDDMHRHGLKLDFIVTDYMKLKAYDGVNQLDIARGDMTSMAVAAASILAKVTRDDIMIELDKKYPMYDLAKHKGYPTKEHLELLEKYGVNKDIYRLTYKPVMKVIEEKSKLF